MLEAETTDLGHLVSMIMVDAFLGDFMGRYRKQNGTQSSTPTLKKENNERKILRDIFMEDSLLHSPVFGSNVRVRVPLTYPTYSVRQRARGPCGRVGRIE